MQCKCGSETTNSTHEVKTIKCAKEWYLEAKAQDLPSVVQSYQCNSCGRFGFKMYNHHGDLMYRRGV